MVKIGEVALVLQTKLGSKHWYRKLPLEAQTPTPMRNSFWTGLDRVIGQLLLEIQNIKNLGLMLVSVTSSGRSSGTMVHTTGAISLTDTFDPHYCKPCLNNTININSIKTLLFNRWMKCFISAKIRTTKIIPFFYWDAMRSGLHIFELEDQVFHFVSFWRNRDHLWIWKSLVQHLSTTLDLLHKHLSYTILS